MKRHNGPIEQATLAAPVSASPRQQRLNSGHSGHDYFVKEGKTNACKIRQGNQNSVEVVGPTDLWRSGRNIFGASGESYQGKEN
jgi:hypothetical protein